MRIYLTGFMGSGKSTVGRALATLLGCDFYDLDMEIERHASKSIPSIFEEQGENTFRQIETKLLYAIHSDPCVIATGGGCFLFNQDWMLQNGTVVHLEVPFSVLTERIGANPSRPLWKNAEKLYQERRDQYKAAHHSLDANRSPDEVATDIQKLLTDKNT